EDLPLVEWACRTLLYRTQEQLHGLLRNFPNRFVAALLRIAVFPRGRTYSAPSDELCQRIAELMINPTEARRRLADVAYVTPEPSNPVGLLQQALELAERVRPVERKIFDARRAGRIKRDDVPGQIDEAERAGIISVDEAALVRDFDREVMSLTGVDDFDRHELARTASDGFFAGGGGDSASAAPEAASARPDEPTETREAAGGEPR